MNPPSITPWLPLPPDLLLSSRVVDVCQWPTDFPPDEVRYFESLLSAAERAKANRLLDPVKRAQSITARGMLRTLLGRLIGARPEKLTFTIGPRGKPSLSPPWSAVEFNLSHTHGLVLVALSHHRAVGIDIEWINPQTDWRPIARQFCSADEVVHLHSLPSADQSRAFHQLWTRKEALLKAAGIGLARDVPHDDPSLTQYTLQELSPSPDCVATLAIREHVSQVNQWLLTPTAGI